MSEYRLNQGSGVVVSDANPLPVTQAASPLASPYADQQVVTASAVALTARALVSGVRVRARSANIGAVFVGPAGVTATNDGTGNGFALLPGESLGFEVADASLVYIIGTVGDIVDVAGV